MLMLSLMAWQFLEPTPDRSDEDLLYALEFYAAPWAKDEKEARKMSADAEAGARTAGTFEKARLSG